MNLIVSETQTSGGAQSTQNPRLETHAAPWQEELFFRIHAQGD
jgi:hypothetical protein